MTIGCDFSASYLITDRSDISRSDYDLSNKYLYGERRIIDVINNIFEISSKRIPTIIGKIFRKSSI